MWIKEGWHVHASGHEQDVPKFCLGVLDGFGFFMEFLGCLLVGDDVWAILGFFSGKIKYRWILIWKKREWKDDGAL